MNTLSTLRPASELALNKPHGTRIKYMGGCRCLPCRAANSNYSRQADRNKRLGLGNPLVDAKDARRHLVKLSKLGLGYKTVADAAGVARSVAMKIRSGQRQQIRRRTSEKILGVTKHAVIEGSIIPAAGTWKKINWLLNEGFSRAEIARRLGYKTPALQIRKDRITAKSAARIERLYSIVRTGE